MRSADRSMKAGQSCKSDDTPAAQFGKSDGFLRRIMGRTESLRNPVDFLQSFVNDVV